MAEILNFVDIETTGSTFSQDEIIEIAIIKTQDDKVIGEYQTLIKPRVHMHPYVQQIHGISPKMLEDSPYFEDVSADVLEFLDDGIFVAHNARFDFSFVRKSLENVGEKFSKPYACTVKLSRLLYPEHRKHGLTYLIERFGINIQDRHRAMGDIQATYEFYRKAKEQKDQQLFEQAFKKSISYSAIPSKLMSFKFKNIPNKPGVYIFKNEKGTPIYIGKSIDLNKRVKQHFYGSLNSTKEMDISKNVADIEYVETVGELGALLREVLLVKKYKPEFNHMLKAKPGYALINKYDENGYIKLSVQNISKNNSIDFENTLGLFSSKLNLQKFVENRIDEFELCSNILEGKKGACFNYHLGKCKGACMNKENVDDYNTRVLLAFEATSLKPWPHESDYLYSDANLLEQENFKVNNWVLIESDKGLINENTDFDYDIYQILKKYI